MSFLRRLAGYIAGRERPWAHPNASDLLNSVPDGIVIVDTQGKIVAANSQAEALFGYPSRELTGQPVEILIPSRLGPLHTKHRASFFADPHVRPMGPDLKLLGKRKDGKEFPVEISLSPLRTSQGLFVTSAIRDVTERIHSEEQTKKLNAELAEALRRAERLGATSDLATTMAHEIEAALDSLVRLLGRLERSQAADDPHKELISQAREEISRMSSITSNALALQQQHDAWKKG